MTSVRAHDQSACSLIEHPHDSGILGLTERARPRHSLAQARAQASARYGCVSVSFLSARRSTISRAAGLPTFCASRRPTRSTAAGCQRDLFCAAPWTNFSDADALAPLISLMRRASVQLRRSASEQPHHHFQRRLRFHGSRSRASARLGRLDAAAGQIRCPQAHDHAALAENDKQFAFLLAWPIETARLASRNPSRWEIRASRRKRYRPCRCCFHLINSS